MTEHLIEILGDGAFVTLNFHHRAYPEAQDYWDRNWVVTRIQVEAREFKADFTDQVHMGDVVRFYEDVIKLHANMSGEATLTMLEEFLTVTGKMDVRGGLDWAATVLHPRRRDIQLCFTFRADQSYLPELIQQMEKLLTEFGVRGQPPKVVT
jgi:hypothetical protein